MAYDSICIFEIAKMEKLFEQMEGLRIKEIAYLKEMNEDLKKENQDLKEKNQDLEEENEHLNHENAWLEGENKDA